MIELRDIRRDFQVGDQTVHALADVNLAINAGEYLAVTGPSGSGKSTLLNVLGLLDHPTGGHYLFEGRDTTTLDDQAQATLRNRRIGFVFQFFHLVPRLTAQQNVELPMSLAGIEPAERARRASHALAQLGMSDRAHHRPDQLSGGQRQRVAIARAVVMQPALLLADEPTGNLDQASGADVIRILEELNQQGITLVVVTHDESLASRAQRRVRIVDGRIEKDTGRREDA
ncbi:MAG TPA: ABC transporter ATP-binding protein [Gammaproteobacteria bacterium]|nr:ABC transporter ATP-binding protein [Gammaproteobacteria bacterium]